MARHPALSGPEVDLDHQDARREEPGHDPGQDVADRENSRVQIFSRDGALQDIWDWVNRPCDLFIDAEERIYVAELGFIVGNEPVPHLRLMQHPPAGHAPIARVSICTPEGELIGRVGGEQAVLPGNFFAPHGLCVGPRGDLYVGEVVVATGVARRLAPLTPHCFQKLVRRSG